MNKYFSRFPHGLMFHRFHKDGDKPNGQGSISNSEFEVILDYVGLDRILTPTEWLSKLQTGNLDVDDLCLTFDDGLYDQYEVALPVLNKYKIKAFWFVFSSVFNGTIDKNEVYNRFASTRYESFDEFIDEFLSVQSIFDDVFDSHEFSRFFIQFKKQFPFYSHQDIKFRYIRNHKFTRNEFEQAMDQMIVLKDCNLSDMAQKIWMRNSDLQNLSASGHFIGLHSYSHPFRIADLSLSDQKQEYISNVSHLESILDQKIACMSHPFNSYSEDTLTILKQLNIICGFCSNMQTNGKSFIPQTSSLECPREDSSNLLRILRS